MKSPNLLSPTTLIPEGPNQALSPLAEFSKELPRFFPCLMCKFLDPIAQPHHEFLRFFLQGRGLLDLVMQPGLEPVDLSAVDFEGLKESLGILVPIGEDTSGPFQNCPGQTETASDL
jgi:hypothetical protein